MAMLVVNDYRSRFAASAGREVVTAGQASRSPSLAAKHTSWKEGSTFNLKTFFSFYYSLNYQVELKEML